MAMEIGRLTKGIGINEEHFLARKRALPNGYVDYKRRQAQIRSRSRSLDIGEFQGFVVVDQLCM